MQIILDMVDYVTGQDISKNLAAAETAVGREHLVPLLNQLLGCLRLPDTLLPLDLRDSEPFKMRLATFINICPEVGSCFVLRGHELTLADTLSAQEATDISALLRTRLGPPSVVF